MSEVQHADAPPQPQPRAGGLTVPRLNTTPGVHPYDQVTWNRRDVILANWRDGTVNFEQRGVEFPESWSDNAVQIVTSKYFRGQQGTPQREHSLRQLVDRVVGTYTGAGRQHGYFASEADAEAFEAELAWLLLHQAFSFNSPVWFNVGMPGPQQVSACFLLAVGDSIESILNWYREEGLIFKGGSGAGVNLSAIRSKREQLSSGGEPSGPVSFMRGADASAGTIKSGGATRRAAKLVCLDADHPDIEEFVQCKVREEAKIRALRDAGFDMDLGGADHFSAQFQNANNSVRVTDAFMHAVQYGTEFELTARTTGEVVGVVDARKLFRMMAEAAWECADPGIQFHDTINRWHTNKNTGRITTTNPCGEYNSLDNSSCNLGSFNLVKFLRDGGSFDTRAFTAAVDLAITAMDISVCFADFPTPKIAEVSRAYRQLGLGYANLGGLLMALGLPYDSGGGRSVAAAITSLMTAAAYRRSAELAAALGPYEGYAANREPHLDVTARHYAAHEKAAVYHGQAGDIWAAADDQWMRESEASRGHGYRNAQLTLLAPTGTIGLMMDCDTTGIEPDLALKKKKKVVAGEEMMITNRLVGAALRRLDYGEDGIEEIEAYIAEHGHVVGAPHLEPLHYPVFDCAVGERAISPMGHVRMVAAVQPFLSGAVSKTINMPAAATAEDIEEIYMEGWRLGCKALAVYRDTCKVGQPLSAVIPGATRAEGEPGAPATPRHPVRRRLPRSRPARTLSFAVGGAEGYMTVGEYPGDGSPGEVFVKMSKQGSTLAGVMDAFSVAVSVALQYGVPLETYVSKFMNMRFEPAGLTDDGDVRIATSVLDFLFRRLALDYLDGPARAGLGVATAGERTARLGVGSPAGAASAPVQADAPFCLACGVAMWPSGSCYVCGQCGGTSGCS